ncbi:hypothetical protein K2173_016962 [Erythroxylum novogranatense]|uniref:CCHC-type domain-containing protein n=1 Tax=Erythroxylum novogranatense TaxID=1862640 RepID=A0AAV8U5E8_9ROSI|nr:hypothetical protein K2173_016962 [Erythroxylum novogranatense]
MVKGHHHDTAEDWMEWVLPTSTKTTASADSDSDSEPMGDGDDDDCFFFSKEEKAAMRKPWRNALIVKLLGRALGYSALANRIPHLWQLKGAYKVTDLAHDYFIIRFQKQSDYEHVLEGGPWLIGGNYLTVRQWRPNFMPSSDKIERIVAWIRFPNIPIEYFNLLALTKMGEKVGRVIKIDQITEGGMRDRFARVCVELDLCKPLKPKLKVEGKEVSIEYEGLPLICFECGIFGHRKADCPSTLHPRPPVEVAQPSPLVAETPADQKQPSYGPWMLVQRRMKAPGHLGNTTGGSLSGQRAAQVSHPKLHSKEPQKDALPLPQSTTLRGNRAKQKGVVPNPFKGKMVASEGTSSGRPVPFPMGHSTDSLQGTGFVFHARDTSRTVRASSTPRQGSSKGTTRQVHHPLSSGQAVLKEAPAPAPLLVADMEHTAGPTVDPRGPPPSTGIRVEGDVRRAPSSVISAVSTGPTISGDSMQVDAGTPQLHPITHLDEDHYVE